MSFEQLLVHLEKHKRKQTNEKFGPPDPRQDINLVYINGWHFKKAVRVVSAHTVKARRKAGWSIERALTTPAQPQQTPGPTITCPLRYSVRPATFYMRRRAGWTTYQALGIHPRPNNRHQGEQVKKRFITAKGETLSLDAWAKRLGVSKTVISGRLHLGWTELQAVGAEPPPVRKNAKPPKPKRQKPVYEVHGLRGTIKELCEQLDLPYGRTYQRINAGHPLELCFSDNPTPGFWGKNQIELAKRTALLPTPLTC
jgi:hypothetical protein